MNTMKTFILMAALTALFMVAGQAMGGQQAEQNKDKNFKTETQ